MLTPAAHKVVRDAYRSLHNLGMNAVDAVHLTAFLVAWKRLSDAFDDNVERLERHGMPSERALDVMSHAWWLPPEARWDQLVWAATTWESWNEAGAAIEKWNPCLEPAFRTNHINGGAYGSRLSAALQQAARLLSAVRLRTSDLLYVDVVGSAYQELKIEHAQSLGKERGEFLTPAALVRFMVEINPVAPGQSMLDSCCATGGFLLASAHHLIEKHGDASLTQPPPALFVGEELNPLTASFAQIQITALGYTNAVVFVHDALANRFTGDDIRRIHEDRLRRWTDARKAHLPVTSPEVPKTDSAEQTAPA